MVKNMKKIVISLIAMALVVCVAHTTFASSVLDELFKEGENGVVNTEGNVEDIQEGNNALLNTNTSTNTNTNTSENLPESTPYTGIGDYTGLIFIAVFAVSAIYAFKKVKEYNA